MRAWKKNIFQIVTTCLWCTVALGSVVLLVAAMQKKNHQLCRGYEIEISGSEEQFFIDKKKVEQILFLGVNPVNEPVNAFDLRQMEKKLKANVWVRDADVYFDNAGRLEIKVKEREPIARVFTESGNSFYIDTSADLLPLPETKHIQLLVFTNLPDAVQKQKKSDSLLMRQMVQMAEFINADPFWSAQVEQVAVTPNRNFELVPLIGKHVVEFGNAEQMEEKFQRLRIFYTQILPKAGLDHYEKIDVQYRGQVVATRKAAPLSKQDSLLAVEKVRQMIAEAQQIQPDTIMQRKVQPVEKSEISEQSLSSYDLLPVNADTALAETTRNPDSVKTLSQKQLKQNSHQKAKPKKEKEAEEAKPRAVMQKRGF
jgi:cell division protein FtsQ